METDKGDDEVLDMTQDTIESREKLAESQGKLAEDLTETREKSAAEQPITKLKVEKNDDDEEEEIPPVENNDSGQGLEEEDDSRPSFRSRRPRSNVWNFFQRLPGHTSANGRSICNTCQAEIPCKEGSTTSLRVHLKNKHPEHFKTMSAMDEVKKQPPISPMMIRYAHEGDILRDAVAENWKSKLYSDIQILCGADDGVIKSHQLILGSLSPYLRVILSSDDYSHEIVTLVLPDVSSAVLETFLEQVCGGKLENATIDPSLTYLGFGIVDGNFGSGYADHFLKQELEPELDATNRDEYCQEMEEEYYPVVETRHERDQDSDDENRVLRKRRRITKFTRKNRSFTWKYFTKISSSSASCNTCDTQVRTEAGNTSGMAAHLRNLHPELHKEMVKMKEKQKLMESYEKEEEESPIKITNKEENFDDSKDDLDKKTRRKRSLVWKYFDKQDTNNAKCLTCKTIIRTEMGNTTGMANHLRGTHRELYKEMKEFKADRSLRSKDEDAVEAESEPEIPEKKLSEAGWKSSPVWQFFDDAGSDQVSCVECNEAFPKIPLSTAHFIRHLKNEHEDLYENCVKDKLKNPDLPDPGDTAHPIWKFFGNSSSEEQSENNKDIETFARCKECLSPFPFPDSSASQLEEHLKLDHTESLEMYQKMCQEWKQQRLEEASIAFGGKKRKSGPRATRSAIWNYFKKTGEKTKNICMTCGKVLLCNHQNTTNMIRHLESNHHEQFVNFLKDSGSPEENIRGATEDRSRKRRGPKPTYSDDPIHRTCPDCSKVYSCRPAMLYHRKTVHSGVRPYKCDECGMSFSRPDSFRSHTHSKVRSYLCSLCGKTFARKNIRDQHERAHRGDKRYSCGFCYKLFMTNQQKSNHERTHTGEKPFQCNECGRQFAQQHQLTTHMRIHTGEKPYNCPHCTQKFRHLSSRNNHKCENRIGPALRWTEGNPPIEEEPQTFIIDYN